MRSQRGAVRITTVIALLIALLLIVGFARWKSAATITEDDPRWDCRTMGNKICGVQSQLISDQANQSGAPERQTKPVYLCGAPTKKGTPCKRRVKSPGARCWQHQGPRT